ncbi:MAG: S-layer homology domain-containing protein [Syntrophothermaceae bacterium]
MMRVQKVVICLSLVFLFVMAAAGAVSAQGEPDDRIVTEGLEQALDYLHGIQNDDGGFPGQVGGKSSRALTSWVITALRAAGEDVTGPSWTRAGKNPADFLQNCQEPLKETVDYSRLLLALSAADQGPQYNDIDLADKLASLQQDSGQLGQPALGETGMINYHMWSILALASAGHEIPDKDKAREWLLARQNDDGGFGWIEGIDSDTDDTAVAIQTLVLLGEDPANSPAIKRALDYIKQYQQEDGGFSGGSWSANKSNCASNAWVLQGLIAAGENPVSSRWSVNGKNGFTHLLSLQNRDGSFSWQPGTTSSPVTMTAYAIMALAQKPFPVNFDYQNQKIRTRSQKAFNDLPSTHWAYHPIMNLVESKAISGYPDGSFKPDSPVSRAEFTVFMVRGLELKAVSNDPGPKFNDVPESHWAHQFVSTTVARGIVNGRSSQVFDPDGRITGGELVAMLVRALPEGKTSPEAAEGSFWYSGYVKQAEEKELLYPDFQAAVGATRAQCAYSIVQLKNIPTQP